MGVCDGYAGMSSVGRRSSTFLTLAAVAVVAWNPDISVVLLLVSCAYGASRAADAARKLPQSVAVSGENCATPVTSWEGKDSLTVW